MAHAKSCEYCKESFSSRRSDARFCSRKCYDRAGKGTPLNPPCRDCGAALVGRHGNAKFCDACYMEREKRHSLKPKTCPECGVNFEAPSGQKFCSSRCGGKHSRREQLSTERQVECVACGETFTTYDSRPIACSVACKQWAKKYPGAKRPASRECAQCGAEFPVSHMAQRYCSERCSKYTGKVKRRGLMASAYVEDVTVAQLIERDGKDCQLCHSPINFKVRHPEALAPVIDHAIPISLGGPHSLDNTQLAHSVCNSAKGNRLVFISEVMPSCQIQRQETSPQRT